MTRESDIMHEAGSFFVLRERCAYTVHRNGHVHATADSSYALTDDGLSLAKARADYLARREAAPKTYRVELANKIVRGRAVGNLYGVAVLINGRRAGWHLEPQESREVAEREAARANEATP